MQRQLWPPMRPSASTWQMPQRTRHCIEGFFFLDDLRFVGMVIIYGCFLKWWYPHFTPQNDHFLVKPMVVGYQHFRKPPYMYIHIYINRWSTHSWLEWSDFSTLGIPRELNWRTSLFRWLGMLLEVDDEWWLTLNSIWVAPFPCSRLSLSVGASQGDVAAMQHQQVVYQVWPQTIPLGAHWWPLVYGAKTWVPTKSAEIFPVYFEIMHFGGSITLSHTSFQSNSLVSSLPRGDFVGMLLGG